MRHRSTWKILFIVGLIAAATTCHAATFKCTNKKTGQASFSDRSCDSGDTAKAISVKPTNITDSTLYQPPTEGDKRNDLQNEFRGSQSVLIRDESSLHQERNDICEKLTPSPRGYTAAQQRLLAQCAGISLPPEEDSTNGPIPAPPLPPSVITNCDSTGCWDNQGVRYTRGAGNTYFPSDGSHPRQLINGQMQ